MPNSIGAVPLFPAKVVWDLPTICGEGGGVLKMDQYEMIRTGCRVYGKNISEMARMTGHSRNTIKKAIRGEPWGKNRKNRVSKLGTAPILFGMDIVVSYSVMKPLRRIDAL